MDSLLKGLDEGNIDMLIDGAPEAEGETEALACDNPAVEAGDAGVANSITFDRKFRGYDRGQVDDYIARLTEDYHAICRWLAALEQENYGLRRALAERDYYWSQAQYWQNQLSPGNGSYYENGRGF
jgi:DivIVA domain-containing protein